MSLTFSTRIHHILHYVILVSFSLSLVDCTQKIAINYFYLQVVLSSENSIILYSVRCPCKYCYFKYITYHKLYLLVLSSVNSIIVLLSNVIYTVPHSSYKYCYLQVSIMYPVLLQVGPSIAIFRRVYFQQVLLSSVDTSSHYCTELTYKLCYLQEIVLCYRLLLTSNTIFRR